MTYRLPCPPDCDHCERLAEAMQDDREQGYRDDWRTGQNRYEREMDDRW
jgi:hypothetical protein